MRLIKISKLTRFIVLLWLCDRVDPTRERKKYVKKVETRVNKKKDLTKSEVSNPSKLK